MSYMKYPNKKQKAGDGSAAKCPYKHDRCDQQHRVDSLLEPDIINIKSSPREQLKK